MKIYNLANYFYKKYYGSLQMIIRLVTWKHKITYKNKIDFSVR